MAVLSKDTLTSVLSGEITLCLASKVLKRTDLSQIQRHNKLINFPSYLCRVELYETAQKSHEVNKIVGQLVVESEIKTREQSLTLIDWEVVCEKVSNMPDIPIFSNLEDTAEITGTRKFQNKMETLTSPVQVYYTNNTTHQVQNLFHLLQQKSISNQSNHENLDSTQFSGNSGVPRKRSVADRTNPTLVAVAWGQNHRVGTTSATAINSLVAKNLLKNSAMAMTQRETLSTDKSLVSMPKSPDTENLVESEEETGSNHKPRNEEDLEEIATSEVSETASLISKLSDDILTLENCSIEQFVTDEVACSRRPWDKSSMKSFLKYEQRCIKQINVDSNKTNETGDRLLRHTSSPDQFDEVLNFINSEVSEIESLVCHLD